MSERINRSVPFSFKATQGIALVLVVSILTVVAISVVSFIFTMRMESRIAANYLWQQKAHYLAEAGVTHAMAVLKEDKFNGLFDTNEDPWRSTFSGTDIDNDEDGEQDSRWVEIVSDGETIGRYAVFVEDESSKIDINAAGFHNQSPLKETQGATPFEVSLEEFLEAKGVSSAQSLAQAIIDYRYGPDQAPGEKDKDDNQNALFLAHDGVDNDADGEIDQAKEGTDEPQEFSASYPFGDDRPFLSKKEIKKVPEVSEGVYNQIQSEITVYSQTLNVDRNRDLVWDINYTDAQQLLDIFLASGVSSSWQKAVNLADFVDSDFAQSVVARSSLLLYTMDQGPKGDWQWVGDHYESKTYGGIKGTWTWTGIEAGEYFVIIHGTASNQYVGDVTLQELTQAHLRSGETFSLFPSGTVTIDDSAEGQGSLTLVVQNNESLGTTCYFKYLELVSVEGKVQGEIEEVRGAEGVRINEIMVQPVIELSTDAEQSPGGDWIWQSDHYNNAVSAGAARGQGTWVWYDIPDGEYYLTVFGAASGQVVGDVLADGTTQEDMRSGERFTEHATVTISAGIFRLDIQNNLSSGSCYFKSVLLSQQPDGEFIELVNLTPNEVALDGWNLEVSGTDGWPASIPLGATIGPGEYLVLAVDRGDSCTGLQGNGISFEDIWGELPAVQLDFTRSLTDYSDMIDDAPAEGEGKIVLRDAHGNIVDTQKYFSFDIEPYRSMEKGDPTTSLSIWYDSRDLTGATPGRKNFNSAIIIEESEEQTIGHELEEVQIKNSPLANLGEITKVSSGSAWAKIETGDVMNLADRITVYSLRLEAEGHKMQEEDPLAGESWAEQLRSSPYTSWFTSQNEAGAQKVGTWLWDQQQRIPNGVYTLYLYGEKDEAIAVSFRLADDNWTDFTPALTPGINNGVCFGRIEIGMGTVTSLPAQTIEMRVKNVSSSQTAHFDYICLTPLPYVAGKINVNTASTAVLQALPLIDSTTAQRIIYNRPFGNKQEKGRGIGDLLFELILDEDQQQQLAKFSAISNLVTVRSDTYQIIAIAQALRKGKVMAEKRIRAIIER